MELLSVADPQMTSVLWILILGAFGAFVFGYGTGSNDVANAFGTSVGSKTLTLRQAVVIAAIFEFLGAMLLGRVSTSTIAGGVASINAFKHQPEAYAYGMMIALWVAGVWQIVASYFELNVSATHSIIGTILGFALVWDANGGVRWADPDPASFPPYKGVVPIILSWFISPILTGLVAAALFLTLRTLVLRRSNGYKLSFSLLPIFVTVTVFICVFFIFTKGLRKTISSGNDDWNNAKSAWVSAVVAIGVGVLAAVLILPRMHSNAKKKFAEGKVTMMNAEGQLETHTPGDVESLPATQSQHPSDQMYTSPGKTSQGSSTSGYKNNKSNSAGSDRGLEGTSSGSYTPHLMQDRSGHVLVPPEQHVLTPEEREVAIKTAVFRALETRRLKEHKKHEQEEQEFAAEEEGRLRKLYSGGSSESSVSVKLKRALTRTRKAVVFAATYGTTVNIHDVVEEDPIIAAIHANAEVFDPKIEFAFQYLQVFSAICVMFAHGGGEVGYAVGPLATIWRVYTEGSLSSSVVAPVWVIFIGAFGLVLGLATYGYKVTRAMGVRMSKLSPTRGFCAELATALVILVCSQFGLPTSSSQCITGAIIGVGTLEGKMGVNWLFFARQFSGWVATLVVSGLCSAALFAQGVHAPCKD